MYQEYDNNYGCEEALYQEYDNNSGCEEAVYQESIIITGCGEARCIEYNDMKIVQETMNGKCSDLISVIC